MKRLLFLRLLGSELGSILVIARSSKAGPGSREPSQPQEKMVCLGHSASIPRTISKGCRPRAGQGAVSRGSG